MGIGITVFVSISVMIICVSSLMGDHQVTKPLPEKFALGYYFKESMPDFINRTSFVAQLFPDSATSIYDFIRALEDAKTDERVTMFVAKLKDGDYSLTQIETLRNAIIDFRSSGKKAYVYADSIGGFSNGLGEYWLASAFDEIWVQPIGNVSVNGLRVEQPFAKGALDKIGVNMEFEQRKEFKSGPEMYTRTAMSDENYKSTKAMTDSIMRQIIDDIAEERDLSAVSVKQIIDRSPFTLDEAVRLKLVDRVGYLDELEDLIKNGKDNDFEFVSLPRYSSFSKNNFVDGNTQTAIIKIEGMILDEAPYSHVTAPLALALPDNVASSEAISRSIMDATEDDDIKVIILRINSPGGSPSASETIRRAVVKAREKGKYVIASMGDVAASGGYWIAVNADEIIASGLTITGSIGVYGGKPDLSSLWEKIGINWGVVEYGGNSGMWSINKPYSENERRRLSVLMDNIYREFVSRVAEGRNIDVQSVEKIAKGRVWIGKDAKQHQLIDSEGNLLTSLTIVAAKIGVKDWRDVQFDLYPVHDDPFAEIMDLIDLPGGIDVPTIPQSMLPIIFPSAIVSQPYMRLVY